MEKKAFIKNSFNKILKETLEDKANEIMEKITLNLDKEVPFSKPGSSFDYVEEYKNVCDECGGYKGGEMIEGMMCECGPMYEELKGGQKKLDVAKPYGKLTKDDFAKLRRGVRKHMEENAFDQQANFMRRALSGDNTWQDEPYVNQNPHLNEPEGGLEAMMRDEMPGYPEETPLRRHKKHPIKRKKDKEDEIYEKECMECGSSYEMKEKLYGKQNKLDRNKNGKIDSEDFKMLRNRVKKHMTEYTMGDDDIEDVKPYGDFDTDSPNIKPSKKNQVKNVGFNYQKKLAKKFDDYELEEGSKPDFLDLDNDNNKKESMKSAARDAKKKNVHEKWEGDVEVKHTGEYEDMSIAELNAAIKKLKTKNDKAKETGKKVPHADRTKMSQLYFAKRAKQGWEGKGKAKVDETMYRLSIDGETAIFTESEIIDVIEKIVNEEKNNIKTGKMPKGMSEYERVHKADKKEEDQYFKEVEKKMSDYTKGSSDKGSKYEMKENGKFPTENGGMEKGNRKKYTPSDAVDEYIDAFSYPGQTNLVYDEIKPNDEWIKANLEGSSKTGNAQVDEEGNALGNVVPSEVGEKFYKNYEENLYGQEQMDASYKRQPQPVDQAGEETERGSLKSKKGKKTSQSVLNKVEESLDEKGKQKLYEEFDRIQKLMGYSKKTQ